MAGSEPVQCPICGWTGHAADLERTETGTVCPTCSESIAAPE